MGDIISRLSSTRPIQTALTEGLVAGVLDGIMAISTGIVIFLYSPFLGMIVVLSLLINLAITMASYPTLRRIEEDLIVKSAKEDTHMMESIRGATLIKLYGDENKRLSDWSHIFADVMNVGIRKGKYDIVLSTVRGMVGSIQALLITYHGALLVLEGAGQFTIGMLMAFLSYSASFTASIQSLISKYIEFRFLSLHLERLADITMADPEFQEGLQNDDLFSNTRGDITLRNISFRYSESDPWVLKNVNLTIRANDFVAFMGPSGGGKTTLLKLIIGLYLPTEGEIEVDGTRLTPRNLESWRKRIGSVMQNDSLFSGSIADNISFYDPDADLDQIRSVAQQALIDEDISAMPMGYFSHIGDMGSALSGGQKQRVFLARALYRDPALLCLDEGTANLDEALERKIVTSIANMSITRLVVAHRPAFIKNAERVFYVKNTSVREIDLQNKILVKPESP